ncbi:SDR family NAD(P)-dependent oxidoreductase [Kosmotoga arenicorallina]|nr:SDR family NAD(P)-dependent oxidoreductase [Kosmotoga arenicorallina]
MKKKSKFFKYFKEYRWSNVFAMIKNNRLDPKICNDEFTNKLVVVTGATSGIGYVTARKFASKGANLLCINRNREKSEALCEEIERDFDVSCNYELADLSKLDDIHRVARALSKLEKPIDVLIHNAGVYLTKRELTEDGLEKCFVVNYLSSFIINYLLMEKLKSQEKTRIILVNSEGYRFAAWGLKLDDLNWQKRRYSGLKSYGSAKLAQLLSMLVFDEYFKNSGVTINAMHPGAVRSNSGKDNGPFYKWFKKTFIDKNLRPADISAEALYYLGVSSEVEHISGKFFNLTTLEEPAPPAVDKEAAYELWNKSIELGRLNSNQMEGGIVGI